MARRATGAPSPSPVRMGYEKDKMNKVNPLVINAVKRSAARIAETFTIDQQAALCAIEGKIIRAKQELRNCEFESMHIVEQMIAGK